MKRVDVDGMLEDLTAQQVLCWFAFLAVRHERRIEAERDARDGFDDDEVIHW